MVDTYHYEFQAGGPGHADVLTRISRPGVANDRVFEYDAAGRMTAEWQGSTQVRSFSWDSEGRLVSAVGAWGTRGYGYNGLGARVSETGGAVARSFFRDGASVLAPVLRDGTGAGSFRYTPGLSVRAHGASSSRFAHTGLKNTDAQTGAGPSPTVEASLTFDAFGSLTGSTGTWQGNYGYAGGFGYHAEATGLKQVGHRYYDPDLGRFLSRDPIQDGPNWYAYCLNDPVNQVDPDGLRSAWLGIGGQGIIPFLSVSLGFQVGYDFDSGRLGVRPVVGSGLGMGLVAGFGIVGSYELDTKIGPSTGGIATQGYAVGAHILAVSAEVSVDYPEDPRGWPRVDSGRVNGGGGGLGLGIPGAGVFVERRWSWIFALEAEP